MTKAGKNKSNINLGNNGKNILNFFSNKLDNKASILNLDDYRNKSKARKSNYGKLDDLDESSYISQDDYDNWDN